MYSSTRGTQEAEPFSRARSASAASLVRPAARYSVAISVRSSGPSPSLSTPSLRSWMAWLGRPLLVRRWAFWTTLSGELSENRSFKSIWTSLGPRGLPGDTMKSREINVIDAWRRTVTAGPGEYRLLRGLDQGPGRRVGRAAMGPGFMRMLPGRERGRRP